MAIWYKITDVKVEDTGQLHITYETGENEQTFEQGGRCTLSPGSTIEQAIGMLGHCAERASWEHGPLSDKLRVLVGRRVERDPGGWGMPWGFITREKLP